MEGDNMMPQNKITEIFNPSEWLTTGQAASFLKVAPGTLQNWRTQGKGPKFVKRGNHVYYPMSELIAYVEQHVNLYSSTTQWKENNQ